MYDTLIASLRKSADLMRKVRQSLYMDWDEQQLRQAADAIEELSREIDIDNAAMTAMDEAMPRWNSVEERLPKPGEESLVLASKSGMEVALYEEGFYGEAEWFTTSGKLEGVTHWMPLPAPPEEEP